MGKWGTIGGVFAGMMFCIIIIGATPGIMLGFIFGLIFMCMMPAEKFERNKRVHWSKNANYATSQYDDD
jgi:hypothetical protein